MRRDDRAAGASERDGGRQPLKSYDRILADEIQLADAEMKRPASAIAASGLLAGFGIGISVLLVAVFGSVAPEGTSELTRRVLVGNAYAAGFLVVIFARADLFTEYTTIALLPVMLGRSSVAALGRLWGIVLGANLVGGAVVAVLIAGLGSIHPGFEPAALVDAAASLTEPGFGAMMASGVLAGWLMGMMSWLIVAARETVSQVIFVWVIGMAVGLGHLHHSVTGTAEVVAGMAAGSAVGPGTLLRFLTAATLGNALGAVVFAGLVRFSLVDPEPQSGD